MGHNTNERTGAQPGAQQGSSGNRSIDLPRNPTTGLPDPSFSEEAIPEHTTTDPAHVASATSTAQDTSPSGTNHDSSASNTLQDPSSAHTIPGTTPIFSRGPPSQATASNAPFTISAPQDQMTTDPADPDIEETQSFHSFPPRGAEDDAGVLPPYRYHFGERSHVNVNRAQQDFEQLRRQLTKESADLQEHGADSTAEKGENDKFDLLNLMKGVKARQEEQGVRRVNLGLTWRDLNVYGDDVSHSEIPMFLTPLYKMFNLKAYWKRFTHRGPKPTSHILHNLTGFVKEGGMLLVLGRPGSGCSTLLRVLSNETRTYKRITGEVHFSGIPAKEFAKHYRGEVQYNQEEDAHHPTVGLLPVQSTHGGEMGLGYLSVTLS